MKLFTKEVKIAVVAIMGIVVLFFGMNFLKGISLFSDDNTYYITFDDISGLSTSSPIYANGFKVGAVRSINYDFSKSKEIKVAVGLSKELRVPQGSRAEIASDLLGNVKVNLILADNTSAFVETGGTIPGGINAGAMAKAAQMIPQIEKMLPKIDSILANLNTITADPAITQSLHNVQYLTNDLKTTTAQLNTLMASLNKEVPDMMSRANSVLDNTNHLTSNLAAVDVAGTMQKVEQTLSNVQQFTTKLNDNSGSLGLLMNDKSLYNNLNSVMLNADSLMINLRQHPKRYVHFSLFGRKDK